MQAQAGFTLIELMVTLAVVSILGTLAYTSFGTLIKDSRITTQTNEFVSTLMLARSEALKRATRTTVCSSANGADCATSGGWEQGWIVFADTDNDAVVDTGETVLQIYSELKGDNSLRGNTNVASYVSYVPTGFTQLVGGSIQAGTLVVCDDRGFGDEARAIIISATGRPRVESAGDSSLTTCTP